MRTAIVPAAAILLSACAQGQPTVDVDVEAATALSAALADQYQRMLQARLRQAMAEGGPVNAIEVCAVEAPAIAERLSAESGAQLRRTALRNRNPAGAPDSFETSHMQAWADAPLDEAGRPRWAAELVGGAFRYMRAIPTGGACLACHGTPDQIAPEVKAAIAARYPDDRATGFAEGQMRGAFSIRWTPQALAAATARQRTARPGEPAAG